MHEIDVQQKHICKHDRTTFGTCRTCPSVTGIEDHSTFLIFAVHIYGNSKN